MDISLLFGQEIWYCDEVVGTSGSNVREHKRREESVDDEEPMYTIADIAQIVRMHRKTIERHIRAGKLTGVVIGGKVRVRQSDFREWLRRNQKIQPQEEQQEEEGVGCY